MSKLNDTQQLFYQYRAAAGHENPARTKLATEVTCQFNLVFVRPNTASAIAFSVVFVSIPLTTDPIQAFPYRQHRYDTVTSVVGDLGWCTYNTI